MPNVSGHHLMREPGLNIDLRQVAEPGSEPPPPLLPAPRVNVVRTETGQAIEPVPNGSGDLDTFRARFLAAPGTTEPVIAVTPLEFLGRADTRVSMPKPARSLRRDYPVTRRCIGRELVAATCRRMP